MAMVSLGGEILWPRPVHATGLLATSSLNLFGATTIRLAYVVRVPKSGTLDGIEFLIANAVSAQPMRVSFQDLTGSAPDGTADQYRTFTPNTGWKTPGLITSDGTDSGSKRVVTAGDWLAAVMEWTGTTGDVQFGHFREPLGVATYTSATNPDGYLSTFAGATWTGYVQCLGLNLALKYADGSYGRLLGPHVPILSVATEAFGSGTTPDERGLICTLTAPLRAIGVWGVLDLDAAADLVLYDVDGTTVLRSVSVGATPRASANLGPTWQRFATAVDLPTGTYRLVVKPTTASTVGLQVFTLNTAGHREAHPGDLTAHYTSRTDAGAWSQTTTKVPQLALIVSGVEDGAGGGGGPTAVAYVG